MPPDSLDEQDLLNHCIDRVKTEGVLATRDRHGRPDIPIPNHPQLPPFPMNQYLILSQAVFNL